MLFFSICFKLHFISDFTRVVQALKISISIKGDIVESISLSHYYPLIAIGKGCYLMKNNMLKDKYVIFIRIVS